MTEEPSASIAPPTTGAGPAPRRGVKPPAAKLTAVSGAAKPAAVRAAQPAMSRRRAAASQAATCRRSAEPPPRHDRWDSGFGAGKAMSPIGWLGLPMLLCVDRAPCCWRSRSASSACGLPEPVFPLALAFAWAVIRPSVLPPFALLVMGLFLDVFWGGPQGLWPLCLLATYAAVLAVRRLILGQDFIVMWAWYGAGDGARLRGRLSA